MLGYLNTLTISLAAAVANGIAQSQSPGASALTLNGSLASGGVATLDTARRVVITSGGDDSNITFSIVGTDRYGRPQTEVLAGTNASDAVSVKDFLTITSITPSAAAAGTVLAGTNGKASTAPIILDTYSNKAGIGITMFFNGTANASIEVARDDLSPSPTNLLAWDLTTNDPDWTIPTAVSGKSSLTDAEIDSSYTMLRLTQNTFTSPGNCGAKIVLPFGVGGY